MKKAWFIFSGAAICLFLSVQFYYSDKKNLIRVPSSVLTGPRLASEILDDISKRLQVKTTLKSFCEQPFYEELKKLNIDENLANLTAPQMDSLIETSFGIRLRMRNFSLLSEGPSCFKKVRELNRSLRYLEDYLIEKNASQVLKVDDYTTLVGEGNYFLKNPQFSFFDYESLESGDIIISRGNAAVSALIARFTQYPNQFSHASLVYKNDSGKLWTIESHIEIGSLVAPVRTHLEEKNTRSVVYRYRDSKLAQKAARYMFDLVKSAQDKGKKIAYDFGMKLDDPRRFFCSEIPHRAFLDKGQVSIPLYKNKFDKGLLPFLKRLGIAVTEGNIDSFEVFSPGDLEFDPRFDLVAEWRNPLKLNLSRSRDALLSKMIEWIETKGYTFHDGLVIDSKSYVAWLMRKIPLVNKKLQEKFPLNMTPDQIQINLTLDLVVAALEAKFLEVQKKSDHIFTYDEVLLALEKIREEDGALYLQGKKSAFHQYFH